MGSTEALDAVRRLTILFPALADDEPRCRGIMRELEQFPRDAVAQAIEAYSREGKGLLNLDQVKAIAHRIVLQEREREAAAAKARMHSTAQSEAQRHARHLTEADAIIADMTDEDVLREWTPILATFTGKPREWAEKWTVAKVRTNNQLRLRIAALAGAK